MDIALLYGLLHGGVLAVLLPGALWDLRIRRIPNLLTFGGALAGLAANILVYGERGLIWSLSGWGLGVVLLAIPFVLRVMGAGDVKLLAAAGAWGGPSFALHTFCFSALVGAAIALAFLLARGRLGATIYLLAHRAHHAILAALSLFWPPALALAPVKLATLNPGGQSYPLPGGIQRLPFGVMLALGGIVALVMRL